MGWTCLACRLGCCSPVGSAQHRPRREPRPVRQSATGGQRSSARGFGVDVGESTREREMGGVSRFFAQIRKRVVLVWYCDKIFRAKTGEKEREIPGEA